MQFGFFINIHVFQLKFHSKNMKLPLHFIFGIQNSIYNILTGCIIFFFLIGVITAYEADSGRETGPNNEQCLTLKYVC